MTNILIIYSTPVTIIITIIVIFVIFFKGFLQDTDQDNNHVIMGRITKLQYRRLTALFKNFREITTQSAF